ncbi:MAG: AMP-binding protein [Bacteroidia bacterium]|nr:AMP-binding protein [Bacteroidia bacterium]
MKNLESTIPPGAILPNIATMLLQNAGRYAHRNVLCEKKEGQYRGITWEAFIRHVKNIAAGLHRLGFRPGDKMIVFSPNRLEMLETEMAVMACGGISVPIFAYFHKETAALIIQHSDAAYLAVAGALQLSRVSPELSLKKIIVFDEVNDPRFNNLVPFSGLQEEDGSDFALKTDAAPDDICLNMYTSGTMGIPKCVQLSHRNILSQQMALERLWSADFNLNADDRFLSYLPWHHSFGGIFERFTALYTGATMYLESGCGKDPQELLLNWKLVKPSLFFSVPKVYQSLVELAQKQGNAWEDLFHSGLKFVFTAAASLPRKISDEFEKRNIPVIEGWGLTETSPCCTLTDPRLKRESGLVGKPIPGVSIRLAEDGEIEVKGPHVMCGYYKNEEANKGIFTEDGWYRTGDIGDITSEGLKLITRKDRIFKLTNGEKVIPGEMEGLIQSKCHYIQHALVVGGGNEYPVALLFPNKKILDEPTYEISPEEGCFCPRSLSELGKCLQGCLHDANCGLAQKFSKIKYAMIIDDELSIERHTLTPSLKIAPNNVMEAYKVHIEQMYGSAETPGQDVYLIRLDTENKMARIKTEI